MGMTINTNLSALDAYRNLSNTQTALASSLQKLSSGLRINSAADDAAGLSISEGLQSQVSGTAVATANAQDGVNVIQTADGALGQVDTILQRMRDLAVQGANDSNSSASRQAIQDEANSLGQEIYRISQNTNFNGINLMQGTGTAPTSLTFQVGTGSTADNEIVVNTGNLSATGDVGSLQSASATSNPTGFDVSSNTAATNTIATIDTAIAAVSTDRSSLGASQNRLTSAINLLSVSGENLTAAESTITDTDMASEMVNYTRDSILAQAGVSMLAQANQMNQGVLKLFG